MLFETQNEIYTGRSSAVQWTVNIIPSLKREVPQSTESQSYSVAVDRRDGAGKINMGAPRKYTSGKSGFILSDVRENPYMKRLI